MDSTTKSTLGQTVADNVTRFIGSWSFLIAMNLFIFGWVMINLYVVKIDVFPFTLLNLMLSWIAGVQAPLIMISQNRQEEIQRDTLRTILHIAEANRILLADHLDHLERMKKHDNRVIENLEEIKDQIEHIKD